MPCVAIQQKQSHHLNQAPPSVQYAQDCQRPLVQEVFVSILSKCDTAIEKTNSQSAEEKSLWMDSIRHSDSDEERPTVVLYCLHDMGPV